MTGRPPFPLDTVALVLTLAATAALATAAAPASPPAPAGFELKGDAVRGKAVFASRCALCHGAAGDGEGKVKGDKPPPTDFTKGELMRQRSDWDLYLVARDGGPALGLSAKMFGWGKLLSDQEIRDAVAYARSLAPPAPPAPPS